MTWRPFRALAMFAVLAACQMAAPPPRPSKITLVPDDGGLLVLPQGQRIDFGRSPSGVIPVLDRELGAHQPLLLEGCPSGVIARHQWGALVLAFTRERFVGWQSGDRSSGLTCTQ